MNLKISLGEILEIAPILSELSEMPLKGAISFKLSRLIFTLEKEFLLFQEERKNIMSKYSPEKMEGFEIEMKELLETVVNLDIIPVPEEAFYNISFTARQALILERIIEKTPLK